MRQTVVIIVTHIRAKKCLRDRARVVVRVKFVNQTALNSFGEFSIPRIVKLVARAV